MKTRLMTALTLATMCAVGFSGDAVAAAERETQASVSVTVKYTGKGPVNATHRLWVWLFDTPEIGPGSMPIGQMDTDQNGADVTFVGVAAPTVWIAVAYDETGTMKGEGPPPSGTPIGIYASATGAPEAVTTGAKQPTVLTFDDSQRMP